MLIRKVKHIKGKIYKCKSPERVKGYQGILLVSYYGKRVIWIHVFRVGG